MNFLKTWWPVIAGVVGVVAIFYGVGWYYDAALTQATEERIEAEKKAVEADTIAKEKEAETERVRQEKDAEIKARDEHITQLRRLNERFAAEAQRALAVANQISARTAEAVQTVAADSDPDLAYRTADLLRAAYPTETRPIEFVPTSEGVRISRAALEAAAKAAIETVSLREENSELRAAVDSLTSQVGGLEAIVGDKDGVIQAIQDQLDAMGTEITALKSARVADGTRIVALEEELKAERRKAKWTKVKNFAFQAGTLVAGILIGRNI